MKRKVIPIQARRTITKYIPEHEHCVLCWRKTLIRRDVPVENRIGYVDGVGQLCQKCYSELQKDSRVSM